VLLICGPAAIHIKRIAITKERRPKGRLELLRQKPEEGLEGAVLDAVTLNDVSINVAANATSLTSGGPKFAITDRGKWIGIVGAGPNGDNWLLPDVQQLRARRRADQHPGVGRRRGPDH
jgi:hypothetical protein